MCIHKGKKKVQIVEYIILQVDKCNVVHDWLNCIFIIVLVASVCLLKSFSFVINWFGYYYRFYGMPSPAGHEFGSDSRLANIFQFVFEWRTREIVPGQVRPSLSKW